MDRATRSTHRAPTGSPFPLTAPLTPPDPAPRPLARPAPPAGAHADTRTNTARVAKNAAASAVALGSCFGTMTALNNAVRATPGMPLYARLVTGLLPTAGVLPTPWVEDAARQAMGTTATLPVQPSLAHDAVAGISLFAFNVACIRSPWIPKFRPATPAGMAATVVQCTCASLLAGGASELTAQWMNAHEARDGQPHPAPAHFDNPHKAAGRLFSQLPAAGVQTGIALSGKPLPSRWSLLPLGAVTGGWSFRRELIPAPGPWVPPPPPGWF